MKSTHQRAEGTEAGLAAIKKPSGDCFPDGFLMFRAWV